MTDINLRSLYSQVWRPDDFHFLFLDEHTENWTFSLNSGKKFYGLMDWSVQKHVNVGFLTNTLEDILSAVSKYLLALFNNTIRGLGDVIFWRNLWAPDYIRLGVEEMSAMYLCRFSPWVVDKAFWLLTRCSWNVCWILLTLISFCTGSTWLQTL